MRRPSRCSAGLLDVDVSKGTASSVPFTLLAQSWRQEVSFCELLGIGAYKPIDCFNSLRISERPIPDAWYLSPAGSSAAQGASMDSSADCE